MTEVVEDGGRGAAEDEKGVEQSERLGEYGDLSFGIRMGE